MTRAQKSATYAPFKVGEIPVDVDRNGTPRWVSRFLLTNRPLYLAPWQVIDSAEISVTDGKAATR